ncbi:MAG: glycerophosphodiester phosphodiesterase [Acidimicrobiia bacterium]
MRPYLTREHPIRMAHRGSRVLWPENTHHAFDGAAQFGLCYIETDVRVTRDGVVVVFHDETLERTTNGVGAVADWDWDDLRHLDAAYRFSPDAESFPLRGTGIGIPRLDDTFDTFPGIHFNIDLKGRNAEWSVADVVVRKRKQDEVLVGGFIDTRTARFRRITKGRVATSAGSTTATAMYAASRVGRTINRGVDAYQLPHKITGARIDQKLVDAIHAAGAQVHLWTVDDRDDMLRFLAMGVDGIITDRPDTLNAVLGGDKE